jgi:hypothetical protein
MFSNDSSHCNNLQVNAKKLSFCALETKYLGFILTREGIKLQQQKVNGILQVTLPSNVKQVQSFVGMLKHYKVMIPCRSHLLTLLTALTKKNIKFKWTAEHHQAFDSLKNYQIRSIITLKDKSHAFYSRKLTNPQMRYTVTELEPLAIV